MTLQRKVDEGRNNSVCQKGGENFSGKKIYGKVSLPQKSFFFFAFSPLFPEIFVGARKLKQQKQIQHFKKVGVFVTSYYYAHEHFPHSQTNFSMLNCT